MLTAISALIVNTN